MGNDKVTDPGYNWSGATQAPAVETSTVMATHSEVATMLEAAPLGKFERSLVWLAGNLLATAAVAWVAFTIGQEGIAPALLFPLAVGAALGCGGAAVWRFTRAPSRRAALGAAVVWGLLVVVGQDYIGHRVRLRMYEEEQSRQPATIAEPLAQMDGLRPSFVAYLSGRVRARPLWWLLEVGLMAGACMGATAVASRNIPQRHSIEAT